MILKPLLMGNGVILLNKMQIKTKHTTMLVQLMLLKILLKKLYQGFLTNAANAISAFVNEINLKITTKNDIN